MKHLLMHKCVSKIIRDKTSPNEIAYGSVKLLYTIAIHGTRSILLSIKPIDHHYTHHCILTRLSKLFVNHGEE